MDKELQKHYRYVQIGRGPVHQMRDFVETECGYFITHIVQGYALFDNLFYLDRLCKRCERKRNDRATLDRRV